MTLTPEDVRKKTFTPVRLREGYDMGEVDRFLDEVEVELTRLHRENDELRSQLADPSAAATTAATAEPSGEGSESDGDAATASVPAPPVVTTVAEASSAAARLLEIAAVNADQLVSEARTEADRVVNEATVRADRLESDARGTVERLEVEAEERSGHLDEEIAQRRAQVLGDLERDKDDLARELEELRAFEREYRSRLKAYFENQLRALDGDGDAPSPLSTTSDDDPSSGLRELLSEDPQQ